MLTTSCEIIDIIITGESNFAVDTTAATDTALDGTLESCVFHASGAHAVAYSGNSTLNSITCTVDGIDLQTSISEDFIQFEGGQVQAQALTLDPQTSNSLTTLSGIYCSPKSKPAAGQQVPKFTGVMFPSSIQEIEYPRLSLLAALGSVSASGLIDIKFSFTMSLSNPELRCKLSNSTYI
jgi:hypothetical protein